ncbi:LLM class flavin-dependent oxidoreductase [Aquisediminimonas sediminicola]|uniref:LLM class flavin-dependent oxidoreductase n=1 Tax=Alteraquisediminimonas sediminicola TaxID=2676787 RepID=UPI00248490B9|nr:LLM class flavin-dependent oxidoreductase [Aquisediminimonas sediminicola]
MRVGLLMVFQNFMDRISDREAWDRDIHLCSLAEPLGFDTLGAVEHHFSNYAMSPDNMQFLAYMAAKTSRIGLMTGAVILPWHRDPLRIVERMIALDYLSNGRAMFGIGRGLAKREYDTFGLDMNEARDRFDEAAECIMSGLETGVCEWDGQYFKQARTEVRPRPLASFKNRFYSVAMSSDSVPVCAKLGATMMSFAQKPWEQMVPHFNSYRELFLQYHGEPAPPPICVDFMACDESAERAEALAREHMANYYVTVMDHYEMAGEHFKDMKGYSDYATNAGLLQQLGMTEAANAFVDINTWGTPQQILDKLDARRQCLGDFDLTVQISYGGMSTENAESGIRLFAEKVLPEVQSWSRNA